LSIRKDFAAAHALLANMRLLVELDFKGADDAIHKAIQSEPENLYVVRIRGLISRALGRYPESEEMYRRVIGIDPLNLSAYTGLGNTSWFSGRLDEAESYYRKVLELSPQAVGVHANLGLVLLGQGRIEDARAEAEHEMASTWAGWARAIIQNAAGRVDEAEKILDEYIRENREQGAFQIAEVYASMRRPDLAFEYLEHALAVRDSGICGIAFSPLLRPLHSDARWQPLLRRIGIPEEYWPKG
jgi:tetratricopeptide (TPR) repeat protein